MPITASQPDIPIACTLTPDQRSTREDFVGPLLSQAAELTETQAGYTFRFDSHAGLASRLLDLIEAERECCPFLALSLTFEPGMGPIRLHIGGSDDAKSFVRDTFARRYAEQRARHQAASCDCCRAE